MKPTIGRIVHYVLTHYDAAYINKERRDAQDFRAMAQRECDGERLQTGFVEHRGNTARQGDVLPAVIVSVADPKGTTVNLQVLLDGNDTYWATSRQENANSGHWPGYWTWPEHKPEVHLRVDPDELAAVAETVADKVAERFTVGWPMVLPPGCKEALQRSHSWHGQYPVGPDGWAMGYIIRPDGKLHLELVDSNGERAWQGTLAEAAA